MRIRGWRLGFPVVAFLASVVALAFCGQVAWGATGSLGGSAQPVPSVTNPIVGQQYDVQIQLSNTSISNSTPPGINFIAVHLATSGIPPNPDPVAHLTLACSTAPCGANELPGTVTFVPVGATGCVSAAAGVVSCEIDPLNSNRVVIKTGPNAVSLGPLQLNFVLATIRVQQLTRPVTFFMQGDATYQGTAGTCSGPGGTCSNVATPNTCSASVPDCDFSALAGAAVGTANLFPAGSCGDGILDPGETCDPPGTPEPNNNVCRADCTFCGDGITQPSEACDPNNPADPVTAAGHCSLTCTVLPFCGDGVLNPGETCDPPGTPEPNGNVCRADCTFCGDGITQPSEACDPNNPADPITAAGRCSMTCTVLSICGDGIVDPGETCDPPGSTLPGGAICRGDCTFCGDGILQTRDGEQCDDGNNRNGDGCSATCEPERLVPTLSGWGMLLFVVLLLGAGSVTMTRRRRNVAPR